MNRETKRLLQRQGQLDEEGNPQATATRQPPRTRQPIGAQERGDAARPVEFLRNVRAELRRVAWPTRAETINSSFVVLCAVVVLTATIFGMDTVFSKFVLFMFKQ